MANERLRQAITQAGLDPDRVADLVEVDVKTVYRWLAGRTPHPRHRARLIQALGREEHHLWPEIAPAPPVDREMGGEIVGAWARADDPGAPDWRELLDETVEQVGLLDYSLLDIVGADRTTDVLAAKAATGCRITILICAPDSIWVRARALAIGQDEEDYIGRSRLELEIETARGHLEPLTALSGVNLLQLYRDPGHRILRFDEEMLIGPNLAGSPNAEAPLLHLQRRSAGGLFDQFAAHLGALSRVAVAVEAAPERYPDPRAHPERYQPLTADTYDRLNELRKTEWANAQRASKPIEQVRGEIRRADQD